jgi:hypothetical protein
MIKRYRKKPIEIEVVEWTGKNINEIENFVGNPARWMEGPDENPPQLVIVTLEGKMIASIGDFIIKGVSGEFYPCKPDIFQKTYELVEN